MRWRNCCQCERRETYGKILKKSQLFKKLNRRHNVHEICKEVCQQIWLDTTKISEWRPQTYLLSKQMIFASTFAKYKQTLHLKSLFNWRSLFFSQSSALGPICRPPAPTKLLSAVFDFFTCSGYKVLVCSINQAQMRVLYSQILVKTKALVAGW